MKYSIIQSTKSHQPGVILIVVLIMLMVLSILASVSIRGATSAENTANQSRHKALSFQAAEAALRNCEDQVFKNVLTPEPAPPNATPPAQVVYKWESTTDWDAAAPPAYLKTVAFIDTATGKYFTRSPECMSQYLLGDVTKYVTTSRGFGPEVSAKPTDGKAPTGTEVWLQSVSSL